MLNIDDCYTAFCIDEASAYVISRLKCGDKPINRGNNRETAEFIKKGEW